MFCKQCGIQLNEGVKFCPKCGYNNFEKHFDTLINDDSIHSKDKSKEKNSEMKKAKKKICRSKKVLVTIMSVIIIIGIAGGVLAFFYLNNPEKQIIQAINECDYDSAIKLYENIGSASNDLINELKSCIETLKNSYREDSKTYDEVKAELYTIKSMNIESLNQEILNAENYLEKMNASKSAFNTAESYYNSGTYNMAIEQYRLVIEEDNNFETAQKNLQDASDKYRKEILSKVDIYKSQNDFSEARSILNNALIYLPSDSKFEESLESIDNVEVQSVIDDAYSSADKGNWDEAKKLLEESKSIYSNNESLNNAYEDIKSKMPITLFNITTVSSDNIKTLTDPIKDRYGNIYDGGILYDASLDAYGLYNLNCEYTKFEATSFVSTEAENGKKISMAIYVDDKLEYYKDNITEETQPLKISIDISDNKTMRIVTSNEGSYSCGWLILSNTNFTKAEK